MTLLFQIAQQIHAQNTGVSWSQIVPWLISIGTFLAGIIYYLLGRTNSKEDARQIATQNLISAEMKSLSTEFKSENKIMKAEITAELKIVAVEVGNLKTELIESKTELKKELTENKDAIKKREEEAKIKADDIKDIKRNQETTNKKLEDILTAYGEMNKAIEILRREYKEEIEKVKSDMNLIRNEYAKFYKG